MVQAAARSGINYLAADHRDRRWWLLVRWILNRIEDENIFEITKIRHNQHLAVTDYRLAQETFDHHWNASNDILQRIHKILFPWYKEEEKQGPKQKYAALMDQWRRVYGDPNDPAVQDYFRKVATALRQRGVKAREKIALEQKKSQSGWATIRKKSKQRQRQGRQTWTR